jgi:hypothetical protein
MCARHREGGVTAPPSLYLSPNLLDWLDTRTTPPAKGALRYDRGTCRRYDGHQWRRLCDICAAYAREGKYCRAHTDTHPKKSLACRFFNKLEAETGNSIIYKHTFSNEFKVPGSKYRVDALEENSRHVIEFLGDFWHGNPRLFASCEINNFTQTTFGELLSQTFQRLRDIRARGFRVSYVWEQDFLDNPHTPARDLLRAL